MENSKAIKRKDWEEGDHPERMFTCRQYEENNIVEAAADKVTEKRNRGTVSAFKTY